MSEDEDPCEYCGEMEYAWSKIGVLEEEVKRLERLAVSTSEEGTSFYYKDAYKALAKDSGEQCTCHFDSETNEIDAWCGFHADYRYIVEKLSPDLNTEEAEDRLDRLIANEIKYHKALEKIRELYDRTWHYRDIAVYTKEIVEEALED